MVNSPSFQALHEKTEKCEVKACNPTTLKLISGSWLQPTQKTINSFKTRIDKRHSMRLKTFNHRGHREHRGKKDCD